MGHVLETFSGWREGWRPGASRIMGRPLPDLGGTGFEAVNKESRRDRRGRMSDHNGDACTLVLAEHAMAPGHTETLRSSRFQSAAQTTPIPDRNSIRLRNIRNY